MGTIIIASNLAYQKDYYNSIQHVGHDIFYYTLKTRPYHTIWRWNLQVDMPAHDI